ncbi:hypothetical protein [Acrocarpospora pleiomorpha]|nr:hypothetical protein [Acrocarpospora pleiomorpha]
MRTHTFGEHHQGLAIYVILEDRRKVFVIGITWLDRQTEDEPRDQS